jgi:hypothetical protein
LDCAVGRIEVSDWIADLDALIQESTAFAKSIRVANEGTGDWASSQK